MLIREIFMEAELPLRGGRTVNLFRNTAVGNLLAMLKNSRDHALRGLIVGEDVFWWDAYMATHGDVAAVYDPDFHDLTQLFEYKKHRLALREADGEVHLYAGEKAEALSAIPPLTRLIARGFPMTVTFKDFNF